MPHCSGFAEGIVVDYNGRICLRIFLACLPALLSPVWANALEAGIEESYVKIIVNSFDDGPPPDVNTLDDNSDGVVDRAQFRLLDTLLRDESAPHHAEILAVYQANLARFAQDNTLGWRCDFMEMLYHFTCDDFNRHSAATFTLAEPAAVQTLVSEFSASAHITLNPANYNLSLAGLLSGNGDLDGDGYTNAREFAAVCGNFDAYVSAAKDPAQNPATLPCCANCALKFVAEPRDAQAYARQPLSLSVAVKDSEGTIHYQWYKDAAAAGTDAPELAFSSLGPEDSGQYQCVVTDASETITSRTALVTVADHMTIARQPLSAGSRSGEAHTFTVAVSGGLPPLHYQWIKEGGNVGGDAPQLTLEHIAAGDAGTYSCVITDLHEQVVSDPFVLTVLAPGEGEGEITVEGEPSTEGEGEIMVEGEVAVEGEIAIEGESGVEGESVAEGEITAEGEAETGGGCNGGEDELEALSKLTVTGFALFFLGLRSGSR